MEITKYFVRIRGATIKDKGIKPKYHLYKYVGEIDEERAKTIIKEDKDPNEQ